MRVLQNTKRLESPTINGIPVQVAIKFKSTLNYKKERLDLFTWRFSYTGTVIKYLHNMTRVIKQDLVKGIYLNFSILSCNPINLNLIRGYGSSEALFFILVSLTSSGNSNADKLPP